MKSPQKEDRLDEKLLFGLVLFDSKEDSEIEKAIDSVLELDYPADKLKIILSSYVGKSVNRYVNYANIMLKKFRHTRLLLNHGLEAPWDVDHNAFSLCEHANYLIKMNHDQKICKNFLRKVNEHVQQEDTIVKQDEIIAIPYKLVSKNYLDFYDYDKMTDKLLQEASENKLLENIT